MSSLPNLTAQQKLAAVDRLHESIALTSGAGCGKTLVLATRFTQLILGQGEGNPFDRFVALTFTEKAASEMIARVRRVLLDVLKNSHSDADRQKLAQWIMELPSAHISTIHSFCSSLLRRHAIQAGIDPGFEVAADELLTTQMRSEAAQEAVLSAVEAQQADVLELLSRIEFSRLLADVQTLLDRPMAWTAADYADPAATLGRWETSRTEMVGRLWQDLRQDKTLAEEIRRLADLLPEATKPDKLLAVAQDVLGRIQALLKLPEDALDAHNFPRLDGPSGNIGSASVWGSKEAVKEVRDALKAVVKRFNDLATLLVPFSPAELDAAICLKTLTALAEAANGRYAGEKRKAGVLDFDDLMALTGKLLAENPEVRMQLRRHLDQLLIDECQDTDAHQLTMLWQLLSDDDKPPAGKLFIVGDIKQSIYRFRGAQAEVFEGLCRRFNQGRLPLNESFRTHVPGVAFVNDVFGKLMRGYEPIGSRRLERPAGPSVEILLAQAEEGASADERSLAQADLVSQRIARMIDQEKLVFDRKIQDWRPVRPRDIAILFARSTPWQLYERSLQAHGVPYYVVAGSGFFRQQEVYDLLNALAAIDNPYDDIAVMGFLRGGMIGLDDDALLAISQVAGPPYFERLREEAVRQALPEEARSRLDFACELVARLHAEKDALGPAGLIEQLLEQTGYSAVLLSQFQGVRRLGNAQRLLESARATQRGGKLNLADFVYRYSQLVMEEPRFEQAAVMGQEEDVVRIMTIHKAKGLEFPVVFLPDLNAAPRPTCPNLLYRQDWGLVVRTPAGEDSEGDAASYTMAQRLERRELAEEDVRKLYVAMTRHEDHLVLVAANEGRYKAGSYLELLNRALDGRLAERAEQGGGTILYGGTFEASVSVLTPDKPTWAGRIEPLGQELSARASSGSDLASALAAAGTPAELPLVGPLHATGRVVGAFAATALGDFEHCPRLFHWRYELRVPPPPRTKPGATPVAAGGSTGLDAATLGTLLHRCMELLDFGQLVRSGGQTADLAGRLASTALAEMEVDAPAGAVAAELEAMLTRLGGQPLARQIASARRCLKELSFVFRTEAIEIAGQIDLLLQDEAGLWHVVDYKSDRLDGQDVAEHAQRYELQMLIYLLAGRRQLLAMGQPAEGLSDASLYFLRSGQTHAFPASADAIAGVEARLADIAARINACRPSGEYPSRQGQGCPFCFYDPLCRRA